jgi:ubiquinone biosynthesis protein
MSIFFRAIAILWVCCRYRLDTLLPSRLPWFLRAIFNLFPNQLNNRGKQLRLACEQLGPIFVKFGQLLSTRPDLIPADIVNELDQLQDNVPPFSSEVFRKIVADELGQSIETLFEDFDDQALGSASVAQVHAATLKDGTKVVIKVIRPNINTVIEKDTRLLLWLAKKLERWLEDGPRLKPVSVVEDYRNTIFDELNLQREAANASQLRRNFLDSKLLYVPEVYWDYCTQHVMVMERIYGIPISDIDALNEQDTNIKKLAERGVEIFFKQVFEHNFFHADMHPGNIFVSTETPSDPQYICVDMAIVGSLAREDQYYLARNLLAMFRRDYRLVAELHVQSGWVPKDTKINEFEAAVRTVCEPIFEKPLAEISFGRVLIDLFSTARRFNMEVQPQLVLLQKTLLNIEGLGRQLYPQLDLWQTAQPYLERWMKNRFHPKTLIKELKRYGPEWMEKFPEIPAKIFNNLDNIEQVSELLPAMKQAVDDYHLQKLEQRRKWKHRLLVAALAGTTVASTLPGFFDTINSVSLPTIYLATATLLVWLLK